MLSQLKLNHIIHTSLQYRSYGRVPLKIFYHKYIEMSIVKIKLIKKPSPAGSVAAFGR